MTFLHKIHLPEEAEFFLEIMDYEVHYHPYGESTITVISYRTLDTNLQWDDKYMPLVTKQMLKDIPNESTLTYDLW